MLLLGGCAVPPPAEEHPKPTIATTPPREPSVGPAPKEPSVGRAAPAATSKPAVSTSTAKSPTSPPPAAKSTTAATPPAAIATKPAPVATLDLKSLEQQLKDTKAIGVMTKLSIKNQVDDLLDQFRAYYQGKLNSPLAELRRSYDLLVMKVLTLLQDGDQALAKALASSREAIWGILSDREKFAKI